MWMDIAKAKYRNPNKVSHFLDYICINDKFLVRSTGLMTDDLLGVFYIIREVIYVDLPCNVIRK